MDIFLLDAGIDQFPNYSLITRPFQQLPEVGNVWASIFLLVAASAAFVGVVRQTELLTCRRRKGKSVISLPVAAYSDDSCSSSSDGDSDEDDDDDEDDEEDEEEEELLSSSGKYEYEPAGGSGIYGDDDRERDGRPFRPELGLGGAVVKTWEGLGLGLDRSAGGLISLLDLNRGEVLRSFLAGAGQIPVASLASPAVVLSAAERVGAAAVRVWDARAGGQTPAAAADWRPVRRRRVVGIAGSGEGKVYVSDDVGAVSVADLRNIRSPFGEMRWEPGSVNVDDLTESGRRGSVVSWCRNAARCFPLLPSTE